MGMRRNIVLAIRMQARGPEGDEDQFRADEIPKGAMQQGRGTEKQRPRHASDSFRCLALGIGYAAACTIRQAQMNCDSTQQ